MKAKTTSLPARKAEFIEPMDCAPVAKLLDGPDWVYEIKLDGYRAVRHSKFAGLREDKDPRTVVKEHSGGA